MDILEAIIKTLPALGKLVMSLVALGHSPDEAAKIVIANIESRREEYEIKKAEDDKALEEKHRS